MRPPRRLALALAAALLIQPTAGIAQSLPMNPSVPVDSVRSWTVTDVSTHHPDSLGVQPSATATALNRAAARRAAAQDSMDALVAEWDTPPPGVLSPGMSCLLLGCIGLGVLIAVGISAMDGLTVH